MAFMFAMGHKGSVGALASSLNQKAICLMPNTSVLQNRIDRDLEVDNVLYEACLCLWHGFWYPITIFRYIASQIFTDVHGPQRTNLTEFGDPLNFQQAPPQARHHQGS